MPDRWGLKAEGTTLNTKHNYAATAKISNKAPRGGFRKH